MRVHQALGVDIVDAHALCEVHVLKAADALHVVVSPMPKRWGCVSMMVAPGRVTLLPSVMRCLLWGALFQNFGKLILFINGSFVWDYY